MHPCSDVPPLNGTASSDVGIRPSITFRNYPEGVEGIIALDSQPQS